MDSACALSLLVATVPDSVTTPLSRSRLTLTSLYPAWFKDLRILSLTSGDLFVSEQPIIAPAITSGSTAKQSLRTFISLLWSSDGVLSICIGQAASTNGAN